MPTAVDPCDVLAALQSGRPHLSLVDLALALAAPRAALDGPLASLTAVGLVELWPDAPEGPSAVLTALAAFQLGLALDDAGHWKAEGDPGPPVKLPRSRGPCRECDLARADGDDGSPLERVPDRRPVGLAVMVFGGAAGRWDPLKAAVLPAPTRLLGADLPWNGPPPEGPCRGCGGPGCGHASVWLCLRCSRYSHDHLIPPLPGARRIYRRAGALRGGVG